VQYSYDINGVIHVQVRQEDGTVDLPIRKDVAPTDIAWLQQAPSGGNFGQALTHGLQVGGVQNVVHKYRPINFSNVEWQKYDRISEHPDGSEFNEPKVHVIANEKNIAFHGYNISAMDEGVTYTIDAHDDFEIECDINTSTISPHPGGFFKMSLGIIRANLDQNGGIIYLDDVPVATVGSTFKLKMSLSQGGRYDVYIDRRLVGSKDKPMRGGIDVVFGFEHDSHYCSLLSHAYVSDIVMMQRSGGDDDRESSEVATWDD
jgi:molecular chaperone DnaK